MELDDETRERVTALLVAIDDYFELAKMVRCAPAEAQAILEEEMTKAQASPNLDGIDAVSNAKTRLILKA